MVPATAHGELLHSEHVGMSSGVELRKTPEKLIKLGVVGGRGLGVWVVAEVAIQVIRPGFRFFHRNNIADDGYSSRFQIMQERICCVNYPEFTPGVSQAALAKITGRMLIPKSIPYVFESNFWNDL